MPLYLGIDLAERHSAAALSDQNDRNLAYFFLDAGTRQKPPDPQKHLLALRDWWKDMLQHVALLAPAESSLSDIHLTIEDIFAHATNGIPATRMQGGILMLATISKMDAVLVRPSTWQSALGYSKPIHGNSKVWARDVAENLLGLEMPEGLKKKQQEDLPDAALINYWRRTVYDAKQEQEAS